jgi:uncharacterized protein (TIGR02217 family)
MTFHEVRFPTAIAFGARGGPRRKTTIVTSGSGFEQANAQWQHSRRVYNAGYGIKSLDDLHEVISFFEQRLGRLYGFRWKDKADFKSCPPLQTTTNADQVIGTGDGVRTTFELVKKYGTTYAYIRPIKKPVAGTVKIALAGVNQTSGWSVNTTTGVVTFSSPPASGVSVTAGFEFDVPVRFDTDEISVDLTHFNAGEIPDIPIIEVRL